MCEKCQAKSKIGKMKRRKRSRVRGIGSDLTATLTTAGLAAVGLYGASKVGGLSFIASQSNYVKAAIKVVAGVGLTMVKGNSYTTPIGVGMGAGGVMDALGEVGLKGIGQQRTWIAGVDSPALQQQPVAIFQ